MPTYNHTLTLQRRSGDLDAVGNPAGTWVTVGTLYASVVPLSTRNWVAAGAEQAAVDHEVETHWDKRVAPGMRLLWSGQALHIEGLPLNVGGAGRTMRLRCKLLQRSGVQ